MLFPSLSQVLILCHSAIFPVHIPDPLPFGINPAFKIRIFLFDSTDHLFEKRNGLQTRQTVQGTNAAPIILDAESRTVPLMLLSVPRRIRKGIMLVTAIVVGDVDAFMPNTVCNRNCGIAHVDQ